jgi:hypothetical protein
MTKFTPLKGPITPSAEAKAKFEKQADTGRMV